MSLVISPDALRIETPRVPPDAPVSVPAQTPALRLLSGPSSVMQRVVEQIRRAAATEAPLVIAGESGTGKRLAAQALHELSRRATGPLIELRGMAASEAQFLRELFGRHESAGESQRSGSFQRARGGTLVIDEIGDLPLAAQAKLLRVLEARGVLGDGADAGHEPDVRLVVTTGRPLEAMVAGGTFRRDLYYRLSVVTLALPPLRERRDDIPVLIGHFLHDLSQNMHRTPPVLDRRLLRMLVDYDWPGNVRQLRNCLENMLVMSAAPRLTVQDLPPHLLASDACAETLRIPAGMTLEQLERLAIEQTLVQCANERTRTARLLGISVRTLQRKLKRWGRGAPPTAPADAAPDDATLTLLQASSGSSPR